MCNHLILVFHRDSYIINVSLFHFLHPADCDKKLIQPSYMKLSFFVETRKQIIVEQNKWRTLCLIKEGAMGNKVVFGNQCEILLSCRVQGSRLSAYFRWKSFVLRFEESVCFFSLFCS